MYVLSANSKYGSVGRTISNYEYNRLPLADQHLFKKFNYQEVAPPLNSGTSLTGGMGGVQVSGISNQVSAFNS